MQRVIAERQVGTDGTGVGVGKIQEWVAMRMVPADGVRRITVRGAGSKNIGTP